MGDPRHHSIWQQRRLSLFVGLADSAQSVTPQIDADENYEEALRRETYHTGREFNLISDYYNTATLALLSRTCWCR